MPKTVPVKDLQLDRLLSAPLGKIRNRIETSLHVKAEASGRSYDQIRADFITYFNSSDTQLTWWQNNSAQPPKLIWNSIADFFGRSVTDIFYIQN